jgi:very-short-patch-repair endonuclease
MFAELATRGRPGIGRSRAVLGRLDPDPPTESELEAMFVRLVARRRLPSPERQASFDWLGSGRGRVDFWYPQQRLVLELDGRRFHLRVAAFESDRRRDLVGLTHGITTVRITHRQLSTEGSFVATSLLNVLAA